MIETSSWYRLRSPCGIWSNSWKSIPENHENQVHCVSVLQWIKLFYYCKNNFFSIVHYILPAFFAARKSTSSTRCCAGSPSGCNVMKSSTSETASLLVKYWYNPSEDSTKNLSFGPNLWWWRDGKQVMYGEVPT